MSASTRPLPEAGSPLTTAYNYDPIYNRPTQIIDPLGLVTSMSYAARPGR